MNDVRSTWKAEQRKNMIQLLLPYGEDRRKVEEANVKPE
jgi:hypothetical protein